MIFRLNPSSGVPLYLQLMEQIKTRGGDWRPEGQATSFQTIRKMAEDLVMNPNTVVRAYRELDHQGVVELKHGSGVFIKETADGRARLMRKAQGILQSAIERLTAMGLTEDEIRRAFDNELGKSSADKRAGKAEES